MPVSVRQALALPALAAGDPVVLGGEAGLDADIRWVHVSEVRDVGAVLAGDELVLTTGLGMAASPAAADEFVRQLVDVGAAGLVIELSAAYPSVPEPALRRARAAGLPLVALNRPVRFVEVTDMSVGRNPAEVLRVLDALQTDELCPCNWQKGQATLTAA